MINITELTPASWFTGLVGFLEGKGDAIGIVRKNNTVREIVPNPFRKFENVHEVSIHHFQPGEWVTIYNVHDQHPATTPSLPQVK